MRVAVDVGGTFTDVVVLRTARSTLAHEKVETVPHNPATGVLDGVARTAVDLRDVDYFVHGTTLGLNAILTRTGARVAIVTTEGFRDVYEIGRTDREPIYDFKYRKPTPLVPRDRIHEVEERITFRGDVLVPFDEKSAIAVACALAADGVDAVVVCFLHSYANPAHELAMQEILAERCPHAFVTLSHQLTREYREYERLSTAVLDAYIKPITTAYLTSLEVALAKEGFSGRFLLTRSGGGAMTIASAKRQPVHLVLSGPAGGVIGATAFAAVLGYENLITLDMGGTSLDASLIAEGQAKMETAQRFETWPISIPTIDIHTVGAGGGSIAWVDDGGHLKVGPQSVGAVPGPACYGRGGDRATVTDAALAVGYLDPESFLGGEIPLQVALTTEAITQLARRLGLSNEETAAGILRIGIAKIAGAVREISIARGHHPEDFSVFAFGGAGPLIAAQVARELGIPRTIIPPAPATFSAFGMLMADVVTDLSQTLVVPVENESIEEVNAVLGDVFAKGTEALGLDGFSARSSLFLPSVEMRYRGQEHTVNVPVGAERLTPVGLEELTRRFYAAHDRRYGHSTDDATEFVTIRLRAVGRLSRIDIPRIERGTGSSAGARTSRRAIYRAHDRASAEYEVYDRARLAATDAVTGPAIVEEATATTVLHEDDVLTVGKHGELVIAAS